MAVFNALSWDIHKHLMISAEGNTFRLCSFANIKSFYNNRQTAFPRWRSPCQTGPTVWITCFAGSPFVILACPVYSLEVRHSSSSSGPQPDGLLRQLLLPQARRIGCVNNCIYMNLCYIITDYFKRHKLTSSI